MCFPNTRTGAPVATHGAAHVTAATALDVSIKAWQRTVEHVGKKACGNSSLQKHLFRFVAHVGSTSGAEQTFSQCLAQFRHLRNYSVLGMQRGLVLAGTRGQAHSWPCTRGPARYGQRTLALLGGSNVDTSSLEDTSCE